MRALTQEEYLDKVIEIHGDTYIYDTVKYKNSITKISVICRNHGIFKTNPRNFLKGNGCPKCAGKCLSSSDWIDRFKKVHKDKYVYTNFEYKGVFNKSTITCPIHGNFEQNPHNHYNGQGCPKCSYKTAWRNNSYYSITNAERNKEAWLKIPCNLYVVKLTSENEVFFKIGISSNIKERFRKFKEYKIEQIDCFKLNRYEAVLLENTLHIKHKDYIYTPIKEFKGYSECFSTYIKD